MLEVYSGRPCEKCGSPRHGTYAHRSLVAAERKFGLIWTLPDPEDLQSVPGLTQDRVQVIRFRVSDEKDCWGSVRINATDGVLMLSWDPDEYPQDFDSGSLSLELQLND